MMIRWIKNNNQENKSFDIDAVTIKLSMTKCHHLINRPAYGLYSNTSVYRGKYEYGKSQIWSLVYFHSSEALNDDFEVLFFHGYNFYTLSIKDTDSMTLLGHAAQIFKSGNIVKQCL